MNKFKLGDKVKLINIEGYLTSDMGTTGIIVAHPWRQDEGWLAVQVASGAIPYGLRKNDRR